MKKIKYNQLLTLALALAVTSSYAATLVSGGTDHLVGGGNSNDDYLISVNANNAGYANTYSGGTLLTGSINVAFNNPIVGYRFVNASSGPAINSVLESGGIVSLMTTTDTSFDSFGQNVGAFYTTTDPGSNLLSPTGSANSTAPGIRDLSDFSGTVDIPESPKVRYTCSTVSGTQALRSRLPCQARRYPTSTAASCLVV